MPRPVTNVTWYCEICSQEYPYKMDAEMCENGHTKIIQIVEQEYNGYYGYHEPSSLIVKTSDGKVTRYSHDEN